MTSPPLYRNAVPKSLIQSLALEILCYQTLEETVILKHQPPIYLVRTIPFFFLRMEWLFIGVCTGDSRITQRKNKALGASAALATGKTGPQPSPFLSLPWPEHDNMIPATS
jgi:hypothetical protein